MAELVVMYCLLSDPKNCAEKVVPNSTADDVVVCLKTAGDKANDWQKTNNQNFIIGWRCRKKAS